MRAVGTTTDFADFTERQSRNQTDSEQEQTEETERKGEPGKSCRKYVIPGTVTRWPEFSNHQVKRKTYEIDTVGFWNIIP
jgi:hypothetical protein